MVKASAYLNHRLIITFQIKSHQISILGESGEIAGAGTCCFVVLSVRAACS